LRGGRLRGEGKGRLHVVLERVVRRGGREGGTPGGRRRARGGRGRPDGGRVPGARAGPDGCLRGLRLRLGRGGLFGERPRRGVLGHQRVRGLRAGGRRRGGLGVGGGRLRRLHHLHLLHGQRRGIGGVGGRGWEGQGGAGPVPGGEGGHRLPEGVERRGELVAQVFQLGIAAADLVAQLALDPVHLAVLRLHVGPDLVQLLGEVLALRLAPD